MKNDQARAIFVGSGENNRGLRKEVFLSFGLGASMPTLPGLSVCKNIVKKRMVDVLQRFGPC